MVYTDKKSNFKSLESHPADTQSTVCINSATIHNMNIHNMNIHALSSVELCDLLGWGFDVLTIALCQFYNGNASLQPQVIEDCVYMLNKSHLYRFLLHHNIPVETQEKIQKYCNQELQDKAFISDITGNIL